MAWWGQEGGGLRLPWKLARKTLTLPACPARPECRAAIGPAEAPPGPAGATAEFSTGERHPEPGLGREAQPHLPQHHGLPPGTPRLGLGRAGCCKLVHLALGQGLSAAGPGVISCRVLGAKWPDSCPFPRTKLTSGTS